MYLGMQLKFLRIHYFFVTINVAPTEYTVASLRVAISCANSLVLFPRSSDSVNIIKNPSFE